MLPSPPLYEWRAWADSFPDLPQPSDESWKEETYIIARGLYSVDVKIRDDKLEIKELLADRDGLQLWSPAAELAFPIPALTLERELMVRLQIGQPLHREHYGPRELFEDIVLARQNLLAVPVRKCRHLFVVHGCRAENSEVEVAGQRCMTAAVEHKTPEELLAAVAHMGLDRYPNLAYPAALMRLVPRANAQP